jgi:hypothetical protein
MLDTDRTHRGYGGETEDQAGPVARQLRQVVESGGGAEEQRYEASRVGCLVLVAPVTS